MPAARRRYPAIDDHLPDEAIQAVIMPRGDVVPRYHLVLEDPGDDLLALARHAILIRHAEGCMLRLHEGVDAVLVIGPVQ